MLISHSHRFLTIDIPKTGTRSLRQTIQPLGILDIVGSPKGAFKQHGEIRSCQENFKKEGWDIDEYFKFSIVRNPWKRYVSYLNYFFDDIKKIQESHKECLTWSEDRIFQAKKETQRFESLNSNKTKYLQCIIKEKEAQDFYILDNNGDVFMDFLAKTETLNQNFKIFCKRTGLNKNLEMVIGNQSKYLKPYQDYYNQELIDMVSEKENWVIEKFNYDYK